MIASVSPGLTGAAAIAAARGGMASIDGAAPLGGASAPITQIERKRCHAFGDMGQAFDELRLDREQPRAAIRQVIADLRSHRGGVDRDRDGADPAAAQNDLQHLQAIGAEDRDPVAGRNARRAQRRGTAGGDVARLAERP